MSDRVRNPWTSLLTEEWGSRVYKSYASFAKIYVLHDMTDWPASLRFHFERHSTQTDQPVARDFHVEYFWDGANYAFHVENEAPRFIKTSSRSSFVDFSPGIYGGGTLFVQLALDRDAELEAPGSGNTNLFHVWMECKFVDALGDARVTSDYLGPLRVFSKQGGNRRMRDLPPAFMRTYERSRQHFWNVWAVHHPDPNIVAAGW